MIRIRANTLNALCKLGHLNSLLLLNTSLCRKLNNHSVHNAIQLFVNNQNSNQTLDLEESKKTLINSLNLTKLNAQSRLANQIRESLLNVITASKDEKDLEFILKCLKKNSSLLKIYLNQYFIGSNLMKLLYVLNQTDKSLELFYNTDTQPLFLNRETILILMTKLAEDRRYSEALLVYEHYLTKLNSTTRQPILNDHLDVYTKSLYLIESEETNFKVKNLLDHLEKKKFELSATSVVYLFLALIKRNELDLAREFLDKTSSYKLKMPEFLNRNLVSIYLSKTNDLENAFEKLEKNLNEKRLIFDLTLNCLYESIINHSNAANFEVRFKELKQKALKQGSLAKSSLTDYAENFARQRVKQLSPNESAKISTRQQTDRKPSQDEPVSIVTKLNESVLSEMEKFFNENKLNELVALFENNLDKVENYDSQTLNQHLKMVTVSLYKLNSKGALSKAKRIILRLNQNSMSTYFDDCSKIHLFLLALNQNDPYYAMGFVALTDVEKSSLTVYKNLKAAALAKINKTNEAINEIKSITQMQKNLFTNDGFIFQLTIDCLKDAAKTSDKLKKEVNALIDEINNEQRVSKFNLTDFMCIKPSTIAKKKEVAELDKKISSEAPSSDSANIDNIADRLNIFYHECKFDQVIDVFEKNSHANLSMVHLEYLSKSCLQTDLNIERVKNIIELINKNSLQLSFNSIIHFFLKIIELNEPFNALEFLSDHEKDEITQNKSVYKNLLAIGFFSIDRADLAIEQIEQLFQISLKQSLRFKFDGRLFPLTMKHLKWSLSNTTDLDVKRKLEIILEKCTREKRLSTIDLDSVSV